MKYTTTLFVFISIISVIFCGKIQAQSTSSPYSMFGIGEIDNKSYGVNSGMAGIGIGLQQYGQYSFLNTSNPASLSTVDTLTFIFDIATAAKMSYFSYGKETHNSNSMNLKKLAFGFRVMPKWAMSLGVRPYSNVGYKLEVQSPIEGTSEKYLSSFEGSGGLSRVYWSNSFRLTPNLSIGANASLLFGTVEQTESQIEFIIENLAYTRKFYFDFGAQYHNTINSSTSYTLGAVYGYKTNLSLSNEIIVSSNSTGAPLEDKVKKATKTSIPQFIGVGASLATISGSKVFTFAADYMFENWSAIKNPSPNAKYTNSHKFSAGAQVLPNFRLPKNYFQRILYQVGGSYNLSNMLLNGEQLKEYALSVGFVLPVSRSQVHLSADFGYRTGKNLIKEKFISFTLGCSFSEMWFLKRFYD